MFNVSPVAEYGRDDLGKHSVAMMHALEHGHHLQSIPTAGKRLSNNPSTEAPTIEKSTIAKGCALKVSLRHAWHSSIDLPYNGPMEEISRKRVRNDYGLLRLLQMGITDLRVPLQDMFEKSSRRRMQDYRSLGMRFHVFSTAGLHTTAVSALSNFPGIAESIEFVLPTSVEHWNLDSLDTSGIEVPIILGYAATGAHKANDSKPFAHTVSSGVLWEAHEKRVEQLRFTSGSTEVDSLVFQIPWEEDLAANLVEIERTFDSLPWRCQVNIRLANSNPAVANFNDDAIAARVVIALRLASELRNVDLTLDTFMDIDRGYAPRHGLIDGHCNFRTAGLSVIENGMR